MSYSSTLRQVREVVADNNLFAGVREVFIGFSGGADSTFLLLALRELFTTITAVHLHHGIRGPEADTDAAWCEAFCKERDIPFACHHIDVPANRCSNEGVEEAARRCRQNFWREKTSDRAACAVALGHHADDRLEELMLRLARGANVSGLTGLRLKRTIGGVQYIRPLLFTRRGDIIQALHDQGITDWCEDSTNTDTRMRRNMVRHHWLPLIRETWGHDRGLCCTLENLDQDAEFIEQKASEYQPENENPHKMARLHPALFCRVIRLWLKRETGHDVIPPRSTIERLREECRCWDGGPEHIVPVGEDLHITVTKDGLLLTRPEIRLTPRQWHWRESHVLFLPEINRTLTATQRRWAEVTPDEIQHTAKEFFSYDQLPEWLHVRSWERGDTIVPFGRQKAKKLQDIFTDAGVPRHRRTEIPIIAAGKNILWVAGIKRGEFGRIQQNAREKIICLELS